MFKTALVLGGFLVSLVAYAGSIGYSYQIVSSKVKAFLLDYYDKLPEEVKSHAYVYETDSGFYTVRVGFSSTPEDLKNYEELLKRYGIEGIVVITDESKVKGKWENNKRDKDTRVKEEKKREDRYESIVRKINGILNGSSEPKLESKPDLSVISTFLRKLDRLEKLVKEVFFGGKNRYLDILLFEDIENKNLCLLKQRLRVNRELPSLYLIGELRYRERPSFLESQELIGRWYSYLGLKFSLLKEGYGEKRYKQKLFGFQCIAREVFGRTDYAYRFLVSKQIDSFDADFRLERERILSERQALASLSKRLLDKLSELDKQYAFLKRVIFSGAYLNEATSEASVKARKDRLNLPPFDVNMNELFRYIETRRARVAKKLQEYMEAQGKAGLLDILKDAELDFILRYYATDYGYDRELAQYYSVGVRFDVPIPYGYKAKRELFRLEMQSIREEVLQRLDKEHSQIIDMAFRLKQNFLHIRNHLEYINRDFIKIRKNLYLWEHGVGKVNYRELIESFLDIYDRLLLVNNYKYINYVYAQKITYLLDIKDRSVLMKMFNF